MYKRLFFLISVALLLGMAGNASAELKALWDFDEGAGTVAHDSVGSYNGDFVGDPNWIDGNDCGMALEFDGNDAVEVGYYPEFNPTGSFSISLWAYITVWDTDWEHSPIGNRSDGDGWCLRRFGQWYVSPWNPDASEDPNYEVTNALCFTTRGIGHASDGIPDTPAKIAPPNEVWIHIACVYDQENHKKYIYFNGEPNTVWDTDPNGQLSPAWQKLYIGARSNAADTDIEAPFTGKLDDVRFYDHALSPGEIIPNYMEARKPDPNNNTTIPVTSYTLRWEVGCGVLSADDYHVWFSADWNDVNESTEDANEGTTGGNDFYGPVPLNRDKNYYWRIDTIVGATTYPGYIWKFYVQPEKAYDPDPCDGHGFTAVEPVLSWKAGAAATTGHNVYFGLDFNEVNDANAGSMEPSYQTILPVGDTNWAPAEDGYGKLDVNMVYYWRIDEVGTTTAKGDVWSFKTVPVERLGSILREIWTGIDGNAVADLTSSSGYPDAPTSTDYLARFEGPAVGDSYGSRLHGWLYVWDTNDYTFWIASRDNSELWLSSNDSADNAVKIASLSTGEGFAGYRQWNRYPEQQSSPIHLQAGERYYICALQKTETPYGNDHVEVAWSTDPNADPNTAEIIGGTYYMVPYLQPTSFSPTPRNDTTDVRSMPILNWKPGAYAATHDVYFGTDFNDVNDASRTYDPYGVLVKQDHDSNSIDIADEVGTLPFDATHYWRIDDINMATDPCLWKGRVWKFTTGRYHVVEDFEEYDNTGELDDVWDAHSDVNAASDVLGGQSRDNQAMAIKYSNASSPYYSEAFADTNVADSNGINSFDTNWRLQDVKALSLWFHGVTDLRGSYTGTDPYTLEGDGAGINNKKYDTCYFFYKEIDKTTFMVKAKVDSLENTDPSAMAGVMVRDTLDPDSIYVATVVTPDGRVIFMGRGSIGGNSSSIGSPVSGITTPHWVRITRFQPTGPAIIFAEHSENGVDWEQIGNSQLFAIGTQPTYIGLCVTSNVFGDLCTAELSNVYMAKNVVQTDPDGTDVGNPDSEADIGDYVYNAPEPMYVTLQDSDSNWTEYYENKDANVTQTGEWTQWRLDLKNFDDNDVDPCDIQRMYIGIGDKSEPAASGSGIMYIDDIRLYLAEFYEPECPPLQADLVRNGEVNYDDLKTITDNWLISNYVVTPTAPPNEPNLIAWYRLEQDASDSAGSRNGEPNGIKTADYVTGIEGDYALDLKGDANFIETDYNAVHYGIAGNNARTITVWAKTRSFDEFAGVYEIGGFDENGQDFSMLTNGEEPNVWRANHEGGPEEWDIDFEYPSLDTWVHLAHTYDGSAVTVYADGYAVARRVLDLNTTDTKTFSIGRYTSWGAAGYFDGIVDDVRIYDYALNPNEAAYIARYPDANAFTQPLELLLTPQDPNINLYGGEDPEIIDFRDIAVFGEHWDETQIWPTW